MNIAFDIGGVLSKHPERFRYLLSTLRVDHTIYVITDMHVIEEVNDLLKMNYFEDLVDHVHCADYQQHGEACKAVLLKELKIDMFFDDFIGYMVWPWAEPAPIRCLLFPDPYKPYWSENWKTPEGFDFGRRIYKNGT